MPRRERTAPPSPWPPVAEIPVDDFTLSAEQKAELIGLLPERLAQLGTPPLVASSGCGTIAEPTVLLPQELAALACPPEAAPADCKTIAELIVKLCEEYVQRYHSLGHQQQMQKVPANPTNIARAINDLVVALRPFASGAIDGETMDAISAVLGVPTDEVMARLATIRTALVAREKAVRALRVPGEARRNLQILCGGVGSFLRQFGEANEAPMTKAAQARFLDRLLTFAEIPHPSAEDNPKRLIALLHS